jgi:hypothetical protein
LAGRFRSAIRGNKKRFTLNKYYCFEASTTPPFWWEMRGAVGQASSLSSWDLLYLSTVIWLPPFFKLRLHKS